MPWLSLYESIHISHYSPLINNGWSLSNATLSYSVIVKHYKTRRGSTYRSKCNISHIINETHNISQPQRSAVRCSMWPFWLKLPWRKTNSLVNPCRLIRRKCMVKRLPMGIKYIETVAVSTSYHSLNQMCSQITITQKPTGNKIIELSAYHMMIYFTGQ